MFIICIASGISNFGNKCVVINSTSGFTLYFIEASTQVGTFYLNTCDLTFVLILTVTGQEASVEVDSKVCLLSFYPKLSVSSMPRKPQCVKCFP